MAADDREILNRAVLADDGVQPDHALNAGLLGQRRINRLRLLRISFACCTLPPTRMRCGVFGLLFRLDEAEAEAEAAPRWAPSR